MLLPKPLLVPFVALALWIVSATPCHGQSNEDAGQTDMRTQPLMSASAMTTTFYSPVNVNARELAKLAHDIHGRNISIEEKGGHFATPVRNIQTLGDSLLVYEDEEGAQRILSWCHKIDAAMKGEEEPEEQVLTVAEWRPKNISLMTGYSSLTPFQRSVREFHEGQFVSENQNITLLKDQGTLVLRDTPRQIEAMVALLDRIDRPEEQLMLTAMVITGQHGTGEDRGDVPAELTQHLSQMVPFGAFRTESLGMVRSSARSRDIELAMDAGNRLQVRPEVFDPETSTLTAVCEFTSANGLSFETRTTLRAGEYTVLGASGSQPLFCVLRIERLD